MSSIKSNLLLLLAASLNLAAARRVHFSIDITPGLLDPTNNDPRPGILVNETFPGPRLQLRVGDDVEFEAKNLYHEDVAIHFHGIKQSATPWSDGVPGVTQAPIHPGSSFLYRWRADEAGTFFYHGHTRGHIMDGLYGAIVIEPDDYASRPFHFISDDESEHRAMKEAEAKLEPLLLGDYTHMPFKEFDQAQTSADIEILCMDSIIINGAGSEYCLSRNEIDAVTDSGIWKILDLLKLSGGLTNKGCLPAEFFAEEEYNTNLTALPPRAIDECRAGSHSQGNYSIQVDSGNKWAALSLINAGAQHPLTVSIDNHTMHVFSVDGQYIRPFAADQVAVGNGNRIHVLVKLDQQPGRYTMRVTNQLPNQVVAGFAELIYNNITEYALSKSQFNYAGKPLPGTEGFRLFDETMSTPYPPTQPASTVAQTHKLLLKKLGAPHGSAEWTMSGISGYNRSLEHADHPLLFDLPHDQSDLIIRTKQNDWIDIIIETEGPVSRYHPMHKHGNKFYVIGSGTGRYPWDTVEEGQRALPAGTFNLENPPYLDTVRTTTSMVGAWMVVRYKAEFAGAWMFHCHIQPHLSGGMGVIILDGVDNWPKMPDTYLGWNGFAGPGRKGSKSIEHGELKS